MSSLFLPLSISAILCGMLYLTLMSQNVLFDYRRQHFEHFLLTQQLQEEHPIWLAIVAGKEKGQFVSVVVHVLEMRLPLIRTPKALLWCHQWPCLRGFRGPGYWGLLQRLQGSGL